MSQNSHQPSRPAEIFSRNRRSMIAGLIAIGLAVGIYFSISHHASTDTFLFDGHQFPDSELNRMQIAFAKSSLNDFEIEDKRLKVPSENRFEYLKALDEHGAVPESFAAPQENQSPLASLVPREDRLRNQQEAKNRRIRQMVGHMNFVDQVWVEYDELKSRGLQASVKRTAVIGVRAKNSAYLTELQVVAIRDIIRGSVAGLENKDVVITDMNANRTHTWNENNDRIAKARLQKQIRLNNLQHSIATVLKKHPDASVQVFEVPVLEVPEPVSPTASATSAIRKNAKQKVGKGLGDEKVSPGANKPVSIFANHSNSKKTTSARNSHDPSSSGIAIESENAMVDRPISKANVLITIGPETISQIVTQFQNPESTKSVRKLGGFDGKQASVSFTRTEVDAAILQIKKIVTRLLVARGEKINEISIVADASIINSVAKKTEPTGIDWAKTRVWLKNNWQVLSGITVGLLLIVLLTTRSGTQSEPQTSNLNSLPNLGKNRNVAPNPSASTTHPAPTTIPIHKKEAAQAGNAIRSTGDAESLIDKKLRDEIAELVKNDPAQATEVLKSWMKDAA